MMMPPIMAHILQSKPYLDSRTLSAPHAHTRLALRPTPPSGGDYPEPPNVPMRPHTDHAEWRSCSLNSPRAQRHSRSPTHAALGVPESGACRKVMLTLRSAGRSALWMPCCHENRTSPDWIWSDRRGSGTRTGGARDRSCV